MELISPSTHGRIVRIGPSLREIFQSFRQRRFHMTMSTKLRGLAALIAITVALAFCGASWGQVLKGSISGTVVDPQGAVVSGAQVKAKNIETGAVLTTTSDGSGLFRLNLLQTGT